MPYLYTAAEENSRTGVPIMRPIFLEFPHATTDGSPFDLESGSEFLFGPDILVAPNPSPEEIAPYEIHLPPGVWYDYWTGEQYIRSEPSSKLDLEKRDQLTQSKPVMVTPTAAELPVYVHGGSIIPFAPLTQSTMEKPEGPLTVRIYATPNSTPETCHGEIYLDDGISFNFRKGDFLRRKFTCTAKADGSLEVSFSAAEGEFRPWWGEVKLEIVGWKATGKKIVGTDGVSADLSRAGAIWTSTVRDRKTATTYTLR